MRFFACVKFCCPVVAVALLGGSQSATAESPPMGPCFAVDFPTEKRVELQGPAFVLRFDTREGLRAVTWKNRLASETLALEGPELELDLGLPDRPLPKPVFRVTGVEVRKHGESGEVAFALAAEDPPLAATVTYRWDAREPVLHKSVEIVNRGPRELDRLLNIRLGTYRTAAQVTDREQGFPVYLDGAFFMGMAHPSGWAMRAQGGVELRQYPGVKLAPGARFATMEAVYGVAGRGQARQAFLAHVHGRMRRVVRGHDKPYAIFEPFGARPDGNFNESEAFVLDNLAKVAQGDRESGCHFDIYSVDFWVDYRGDLKRFDPERFPNGLSKINAELAGIKTAPGLWIDSSWEAWSIGGNPAVLPTLNFDPKQGPRGRPSFCRATEPIKSMYTEAFRHHIREEGVRLLKFDNLDSTCTNPTHAHLPGVYATEAIHNAVIDFLQALDTENPDVFLMLYWGYRSPWWLLHADTLFDSGLGIEAASPSDFPAPFARDSITQKLDQAQRHALDVPALGKDSLGVWLSDWGWNSSVGKDRWQEGFVMDLCRGSLLAQPWSDTAWLSPPERRQMADFLALLKARPECFANPRFILGDPWKQEPYGYCCTDGRHAVIAVSNCAWSDAVVKLELNSAWGLPNGGTWDLFRWHPEPARLRDPRDGFSSAASMALRPFEVVLLEAIPAGEAPAVDRSWEERPILRAFDEASRAVAVAVRCEPLSEEKVANAGWSLLKPQRCKSAGGATLTVKDDGSVLAGGTDASPDTYTIDAVTDLRGITGFRVETLPDPGLPCQGPGRAVNGNFALTDFRVASAPQDRPGESAPVALHRPAADFSQDSYGGWPVAAAIDGDPKTGWSIDPQEGLAHAAVFETCQPVGSARETRLVFTLQQGDRGHSIGRLRLWATTATRPLPAPKPLRLPRYVVQGVVPATKHGGLLAVTVEMRHGDRPTPVANVGRSFSAEGQLVGRPARWTPVLGLATYPAPWQAWRLPVEPSPVEQPFKLVVDAKLGPGAKLIWQAHFIARE